MDETSFGNVAAKGRWTHCSTFFLAPPQEIRAERGQEGKIVHFFLYRVGKLWYA